MTFPTADLLFTLHEIEQQFLQLGRGVIEESRFLQGYKARDVGRAHGFFASAHMITDRINKIDRQIGK